MSLENTLSKLAAEDDRTLLLMTAQAVVAMKEETLPGIIKRLDHTNGGFADHEKRIQDCEDCLRREADAKEQADKKVIVDNNRLQAQLVKRWGPVVALAMGLGALIGGFVAGLIGRVL
jgi:hypothetical protein